MKKTRKEILKSLQQRPLNLCEKEQLRVKRNKAVVEKDRGKDTLLVDVSALAYQLFYNKCGGVHKAEIREIVKASLLEYLLDLCVSFNTAKVVLCWDSRTSEREKRLPTYKAGRLVYKTPSEIEKLVEMKKALSEFRKKIVPMLGWNSFQQKGYESDDLIAFLVRTLQSAKGRRIIVANDGDLFQLLSTNTHYFSVKMQTMIEPHHFVSKFNYRHTEVIAFKALSGCKSDNIKGVPSIGEVTATKFLQGGDKALVTKTEEKINTHLKKVMLNRDLIEIPYAGTKLPKLVPFGLNMTGFVKLCKRMGHVRLLRKKGFYEKFFNG